MNFICSILNKANSYTNKCTKVTQEMSYSAQKVPHWWIMKKNRENISDVVLFSFTRFYLYMFSKKTFFINIFFKDKEVEMRCSVYLRSHEYYDTWWLLFINIIHKKQKFGSFQGKSLRMYQLIRIKMIQLVIIMVIFFIFAIKLSK